MIQYRRYDGKMTGYKRSCLQVKEVEIREKIKKKEKEQKPRPRAHRGESILSDYCVRLMVEGPKSWSSWVFDAIVFGSPEENLPVIPCSIYPREHGSGAWRSSLREEPARGLAVQFIQTNGASLIASRVNLGGRWIRVTMFSHEHLDHE